MKEFILNPKDLITSPYTICPECKSEEFGILSIGGNGYTKRCKNCFHSAGYHLPKLKKKVIYLDQFVISNIEKSLNPKTPSDKRKKLGTYWIDIFERLDYLKQMQVIICPSSYSHTKESIMTGDHYKALKRIYELLAHGTKFRHFDSIESSQMQRLFMSYISSSSNCIVDVVESDAISGDINSWNNNFYISMDGLDYQSEVAFNIQRNKKIQSLLDSLFLRWGEQESFIFLDQHMYEVNDYIRSIVISYQEYIKKVYDFFNNGDTNCEFPDGSSNSALMQTLISIYERTFKVDLSQSLYEVLKFFSNAQFTNVPYINIFTLLYTGLARRAYNGQRRVKSSIANDIRTISSLLPYCDALFIDNECANLLSEEPIKSKLGFSTRVFSQSKKDEFINYLDDIRKNITVDHKRLIECVYGDVRPYTTCLESTS